MALSALELVIVIKVCANLENPPVHDYVSLMIITNLLFGLDPFVGTFEESFSCNSVLYMHAKTQH